MSGWFLWPVGTLKRMERRERRRQEDRARGPIGLFLRKKRSVAVTTRDEAIGFTLLARHDSDSPIWRRAR